jgi:imidazolonepropionase-like amidohydrolase
MCKVGLSALYMQKAARFIFPSLVCCLLLSDLAQASPEIPGADQDRPIALVGATIHPVSGPAIADGTVLLDRGKIIAVGTSVAISADAEVIELKDRHIYPGLIDAFTDLGLTEIASVRATLDQSETGQINPNARAQVAVNPDSELIPVARSNGILTALTAPSGGLISGTAALIHLDGWTWEDMTVKADVGMLVNWPRMQAIDTWWERRSAAGQTGSRDDALKEIDRTLTDARAYLKAKRSHETGDAGAFTYDSRWDAMLPVLDGDLPLLVAADGIEQIQSAVALAAREKLRLIIVGGYDAPACADLLKKHDVPVILAGVHRLPRRRSEPYDAAFTIARQLHEAGVRFCISSHERASAVRNLPYHAAMAAAYGLPADEALKTITLYPAEIFGVADRLGSLESGKDATLIVTSGDPLEIPTQVEMAFIQGRPVSLEDRHKRLWEKYREKYRRQAAPRK